MNKNFNHSANHYAYGGMGCMYNFIYFKKGISRNISPPKCRKTKKKCTLKTYLVKTQEQELLKIRVFLPYVFRRIYRRICDMYII